MNTDYTGKVECYLLGDLSLEERKDFEQKLKGDFDLQEELRSYRIIFYLEDVLSKTEKEKFEQSLITDANLKEDLRLQKLANNVIEQNFTANRSWNTYKELIGNISDSNKNEVETDRIISEIDDGKVISIPLKKFIKVAAACLILFSVLSFSFLITQTGEELAISGIKSIKLKDVNRGGLTSVPNTKNNEPLEKLSSKINIASNLLENHDFKNAIPILEAAQRQAVQEGAVRQQEIQWALATAYMGAIEYEKAMQEYEKILIENSKQKQLIQKARYNYYILKIKKSLGLEN